MGQTNYPTQENYGVGGKLTTLQGKPGKDPGMVVGSLLLSRGQASRAPQAAAAASSQQGSQIKLAGCNSEVEGAPSEPEWEGQWLIPDKKS